MKKKMDLSTAGGSHMGNRLVAVKKKTHINLKLEWRKEGSWCLMQRRRERNGQRKRDEGQRLIKEGRGRQ